MIDLFKETDAPFTEKTTWTRPESLPNLKGNIQALAIDVETCDPLLLDYGPGWGRESGYIVGFSFCAVYADNTNKSWYFPVRHQSGGACNFDPEKTFSWAKEILEDATVPKIGANLIYDIGWFLEEGIDVKGQLYDVQFAEALLDEESPTNLEALGKKYIGEGKDSSLLYEWCSKSFGGNPTSKQRKNIYKCPPELVGMYAESDAILPLKIISKQLDLLAKDDLMAVFTMECELIPLLVKMRMEGVTVDLSYAEQLKEELQKQTLLYHKDMNDLAGFDCNVNSSKDLKMLFDSQEIPYSTTAKGAPCFNKEALNALEHPVGQLIRNIKEHTQLADTFIQSSIIDSSVNGRVHSSLHPLRNDRGGTRSGRFSSSNPNAQQFPSRSKIGKQIRKIFIPDEGHEYWLKLDYSQIEYRMLAHFAVGEGSDRVREEYRTNPNTDYHTLTQKLVKDISGLDIERPHIKTINFGLLYGMGVGTLTKTLGLDESRALKLFEAYHKGNPYVGATMEYAVNKTIETNQAKTVMGRISRFDKYVPAKFKQGACPLHKKQALRTYGPDIKLADTYKALNRWLQGSAADVYKKGLVESYKKGLFDVLGIPKLSVHDELDMSIKDRSKETEEAIKELIHTMQTAIPLKVPVILDSEEGPNWAEVV